MKSSFICIFLFLVYQHLPGQGINIAFNSTASGRNLTGQYETTKGKNEFSFGVGVNLNNLRQIEIHDDIYRKKLFATKPHHHINLNFTYQRYVFVDKVKCLEPFLFYDLQAKHAVAAHLTNYVDYDSTLVAGRLEEGIVYMEFMEYFGPFFWIENNIGIGFKTMLTENLYIKQRFGVGVNFILGYEYKLSPAVYKWFDWEFSSLLHFSVGYRFNMKKSAFVGFP